MKSSWLADRGLRRALSIALTLAAFAYLASIVDGAQLFAALCSVSGAAWFAAVALSAAAVGCGVARWWLLFRAFQAPRPPGLTTLARHYFTGLFYNTYLPGGATGDVVRGLATRSAFEPGSVGGLATVVIERALGLCALLGVVAVGVFLHPFPGTAPLRWPAMIAFGVGVLAVAALSSSGRLAAVVPPRLRGFLASLPVPGSWGPLWLGLLLSFGSQLAPALCGHMLLGSIYPPVSLADSLLIVPLAAAAAFLPISVSGAGVRETIFVTLYARVGVPAQAAFAASLCLWSAQAMLAGLGGLYTLWSSSAAVTPERHPQV
jgi:uncharacterized membrane protein YbhN (UPF0104 family)